MAKTEILLETGTNELEIIKFRIHGELYGINVVKVKEIMMTEKAKPIPHSHQAVEGILKPRDVLFTVIDLPFYLTGEKTEHESRDLFIMTNFNRVHIAFRVHSVVGIQRISWENIKKPDSTLNGVEESMATGITESPEGLVVILDFEKIVGDISPEISIKPTDIQKATQREGNFKILFAEDSVLLTKLVTESLHRAGYDDVICFNNGQELWQNLQTRRENLDVDLIITDIEMPQMDGHRLTKLVKTDKQFKSIPLIIFSSLINEQMFNKGKALGANAQLSKPEISQLVSIINDIT